MKVISRSLFIIRYYFNLLKKFIPNKVFEYKKIMNEYFFKLRYNIFYIKKFHFNNSKFTNNVRYSKFIKKNLRCNLKKITPIINYKYSFRFSKIKNAKIYSSNFAVVFPFVFYFSNLNLFKEALPEENTNLFYCISTKLIGIHKTINHKLDKVIHLTSATSANYSHFMLELLPRIIWFLKQKKYKNHFFVLNKYKHINFKEIIDLLDIKKLFFLDHHEAVLTKEAIVSNPASEIIFNPRLLHYSNQFRHTGMFNFKLIDFASREILKRLKIKSSNKYKIYITRSSLLRKINDDRLHHYFKNKGYIVIDCNKISFKSQVYYFSNADKVVLQNGSEVANAMFSNSATKFFLISFYNEYTMPNFWISFLIRKFKTSVYFQKVNFTNVFRSDDLTINEEDLFKSLSAFDFE